ncbi:MAG: hypothetical protein ACI4V5_00910 [Prevotella sp.]
MKKQLLFAALLLGAVSANAQVETVVVDGTAVGMTESLTSFAAGTVFGSSSSISVKAAYDDQYKKVSCAFQGYNSASVNGTSITFDWGVQGNTNPVGQKISTDVITAPTSGAVFEIDVTEDGYVAVLSKLSSNKEYYVWEGDATYAEPMAYSLYMDWSSAADASHPTICYTWPANAEGYLDVTAADIDKYVDLAAGKARWPEKVELGTAAADVKSNGVGFIVFPVYKEAGKYLVQAAGSKISVPAVFFSKDPITSLSISGTDADSNPISLTFIGTDGINGITVDGADNANAPVFNLAGQRVSKEAKGILIQNGKKFIK